MRWFAAGRIALAATLCFVAQSALADAQSPPEGSADMREMKALVEGLRDKLDAQSEQLEHQGEMIRESRAREEKREDTESGLAKFFRDIEFDGWIAGSYFWNFNDPGNSPGAGPPPNFVGGNTGAAGNVYPFHTDHNTFNVDQIWFGMGKQATEESRAGFRFDLVYGKSACTLSASPGERCPTGAFAFGSNDATSQYYVNQAYIEYLMPFGNIKLKAGKFGTLLGAEVVQTTGNFNITRHNSYSLIQPIDHVGVLLEKDLGAGFSATIGGLNGYVPDDPDVNKNKSLIAQIAWAGEELSVSGSVLWGGEVLQNDDFDTGTADLVVRWTPMEDLQTWLNANYAWTDGVGSGTASAEAWGVTLAARYALTERLGFSPRVEYVSEDDGFYGFANGDATIWALTGTLDYLLTEGLTVRSELRWDTISQDGGPDGNFFDGGPDDLDDDQIVAAVELIYQF